MLTARPLALAISIAFLLALASPTRADHCAAFTTSEADLTVGDHYVDGDCFAGFVCQTKQLGGLWIYEESNGIAGLQRADHVVDDTCHGSIRGDTIIL